MTKQSVLSIPIDAAKLKAMPYCTYDAADPSVPVRNTAYLHSFVDAVCAWGKAQTPMGGIGLLVPPGTFPEAPASRYMRFARELHEMEGEDFPPSREITDAEMLALFPLAQYCPKGRDPDVWQSKILNTIRRYYDAYCPENILRQRILTERIRAQEKELAEGGEDLSEEERAAIQAEISSLQERHKKCRTPTVAAFHTHMLMAQKAEELFFEHPFFAGAENQFASFAGYLGKGRECDKYDRRCSYLWRDTNHLGCLTACYVDLDCYHKGFAVPEQVAEYYRAEIDGKALPACSAIVISGYGVYIVWFFGASDVRQNLTLETLHKTAELRLSAMLAGLGADSASTDAARVLRIPGSIHHKAGRAPRPVYVYHAAIGTDGRCHTFQDALAFFASLEKQTGCPLTENSLCGGESSEKNLEQAEIPAARISILPKAAPADACTDRKKKPRPAHWEKMAEPDLLAGPPVPLEPVSPPPSVPYAWLFDAEPYRYQRGRRPTSFAHCAAHDMALLLLYFTPQVDYASRHVAFFWLAVFLLAAHKEDEAAVRTALFGVLQSMENPISHADAERCLESARRQEWRIQSNRLITELRISPRTQPYMRAILYTAERDRRITMRRRESEANRKPHSALLSVQAAARGKAELQKCAQDIVKWQRAMEDIENGYSQRAICARRGLGKGTVYRLCKAMKFIACADAAWRQEERQRNRLVAFLAGEDCDPLYTSAAKSSDAYDAFIRKAVHHAAQKTELSEWVLQNAYEKHKTDLSEQELAIVCAAQKATDEAVRDFGDIGPRWKMPEDAANGHRRNA